MRDEENREHNGCQAERECAPSRSELLDLLSLANQGDLRAIDSLLNRFKSDLLRVVRRRLPQRLRPLYESQDFMQAVWATFFLSKPDPEQFTSPEHLLAFLRGIAANKVRGQIRQRLGTQKSCLDREVPFEAANELQLARANRGHTPSQYAVAREQALRLMEGLPVHHQRILRMKMDGATASEIAAEIGMNVGNVRRVFNRLADRVKEQ